MYEMWSKIQFLYNVFRLHQKVSKSTKRSYILYHRRNHHRIISLLIPLHHFISSFSSALYFSSPSLLLFYTNHHFLRHFGPLPIKILSVVILFLLLLLLLPLLQTLSYTIMSTLYLLTSFPLTSYFYFTVLTSPHTFPLFYFRFCFVFSPSPLLNVVPLHCSILVYSQGTVIGLASNRTGVRARRRWVRVG